MSKLVVNFGGGVNSVAMLIGLAARGVTPDAILFSDTGSEHPETYSYMEGVAAPYLERVSFPAITRIRYTPGTGDRSLEEELNRRKALPALAYGWKTCSLKWKREPAERWIKKTYAGCEVVRALGYDAGETHRHSRADDGTWLPLVEWEWDRSACIAAIEEAGLPLPRKSSCWFCPAMKVREIIQLREEQPDLYQRACEIESAAIQAGQTSGSTRGLGRSFRWADVADSPKQRELDFPCECGH